MNLSSRNLALASAAGLVALAVLELLRRRRLAASPADKAVATASLTSDSTARISSSADGQQQQQQQQPVATGLTPRGVSATQYRAEISEEDKAKASAHLKFGNTCARTGYPEKALQHYEKAIALRPEYPSAYHNMGGVCQRLLRFEEAILHYQAALRLKPTLVEAMSNLAVAQLNAKRPRDAIASCRSAIEMQHAAGNGMNLEASHHLNVAMRLLGQKAQAIEETWASLTALVQMKKSSGGARESDAWERPPPIVVTARPPAPSPAALTVVCVKWGSKYGADYVNRLNAMARRALGAGGVRAFVCFTEDGAGLDPEVEVRPLVKRDDWEGWWFKAHLFSKAAGLSGRVLYLDLDTVLVGSLEPLRAYTGRFATLSTKGFDAEEGFVDGYNTSVLLWDASDAPGGGTEPSMGALVNLHDALRSEVFECLMRWDHWVEMNVPTCDLLQDLYPNLFVDYRTHCKVEGPPAGAACVCFPRYPKPHEAKADWIDKHWVV